MDVCNNIIVSALSVQYFVFVSCLKNEKAFGPAHKVDFRNRGWGVIRERGGGSLQRLTSKRGAYWKGGVNGDGD